MFIDGIYKYIGSFENILCNEEFKNETDYLTGEIGDYIKYHFKAEDKIEKSDISITQIRVKFLDATRADFVFKICYRKKYFKLPIQCTYNVYRDEDRKSRGIIEIKNFFGDGGGYYPFSYECGYISIDDYEFEKIYVRKNA
jgi:hypothetical protein